MDKWNLGPDLSHVLFKKVMGERLVHRHVTGNPEIMAYASSFNFAAVGVAIINKAEVSENLKLELLYFTPGTRFYWYTATGGSD